MELDQARIEDAIVREVADKIIGQDELYRRVTSAVDARINKYFEEGANLQISAAVDAAIKAGFDQEYCRVDAYGRKEGQSTTIRAELEKMIAGYWNTKVDRQGKPSSDYGAHMTRAEYIMTQMVAADFSGDMKQHIANIGGALKDKLRAELHTTVNRLLAEIFHVRTADDVAANRS